MASKYTDTSSSLAREAGVTERLVLNYAHEGLLDFIQTANGMRLYRIGQAEKVRALKAARLAGRYAKRAAGLKRA